MAESRILVAQDEALVAATIADLGGYALDLSTTLSNARRKLVATKIDLFLIGVHFDDSHALDLVQTVRHNDNYKCSPIVVIRTNASNYAEMIRQTMVAMKSNRQIEEYLELENEPDASAIIRAHVGKYVSAIGK